MTREQRKIILTVFTLFCIIGGGAMIYVGLELFLFRDRARVFWIYSVYIALLTGIVIFFGFRLIGMISSKQD